MPAAENLEALEPSRGLRAGAGAAGKVAIALERESVLGYALLTPTLILLVTLIGFPFGLAVWLSLTNRTIGQPGEFVGLANFGQLLTSPVFHLVLRNAFLYSGLSVAGKLLLGMGGALVLNRSFRSRNVFRGMLLIPWIIPTALSGLVWLWMFDDTAGILNVLLKMAGLISRPIPWLSSPDLAIFSVILVSIWRGFPFYLVSFLAGLQTISREQYEAAAIDGAGRTAQFRYVTLPNMLPIVAIVILFSLIWTFSEFNIVYVLTRGGPINSTHLFATYAYQSAILGGNVGQGMAVSLFMLPILLAAIVVQIRYLRSRDV
ncbi:MAG: sugar ABC transporter permease [Chloroflexi bacterium]|nr:sugar ABC transporter permease [Chloroflexota bacterium]